MYLDKSPTPAGAEIGPGALGAAQQLARELEAADLEPFLERLGRVFLSHSLEELVAPLARNGSQFHVHSSTRNHTTLFCFMD